MVSTRPPGRNPARRGVRALAVLVGTGIALLVLTAQVAPGWRIAEDGAPLEPRLDDRTPQPVAVEPPPVRRDAVEVRSGGAVLRGWLIRPAGRGEPAPGVVVVPGAGSATRDALLVEARALAASGVAALVYDKRADGYSAVSRDYAALAADAVAAGAVLAAADGVDARRIGVLGISEGGWVAPLAVQRAPDTFGYLLLAAAPIVTPLEQVAWAVDHAIVGAPPWVRRIPAAALSAGRPFVDYLDFDSRPALRAVDVPVYAVWGADDATLPVAVANRRLRDAVSAPVSVRILPDAGHALGAESGWILDAAAWARGLPSRTADSVTGTEPPRLALARLPDPSWLTCPLVHGVIAVTIAAASVLLPVRSRRGAPWRPAN